MKSGILVAVMAIVTMLLRFLPFLVFKNKTPKYITYLGEVLPPAIMGMLVIYCLKDMSVISFPFGIPELIAGAAVIVLQAVKRNSLISILSGIVPYMVLIQAAGRIA